MNPGDVVWLKSGGLPMVVVSIDEQLVAWCFWHDKNGVPRCENYDEELLVTEAPQCLSCNRFTCKGECM